MTVTIDMWINEVLGVDDNLQLMTFQAYVDISWFDERIELTSNKSIWDTDEHPEIAVHYSLLQNLWLPDLEIRNLNNVRRNAVLHPLGSFELGSDKLIVQSFSASITLECPFTYSSYPLDSQVSAFHKQRH